MAIAQPGSTDQLNAPDHALLHRIIAADPTATVQSLTVDSSDNVKALNGNFVIGTSGKGIDFSVDGSAAGMTSELLDDYEEGTWTPVVIFTTGGDLSVTYSYQVGTYQKVGNWVIASCNLRTTGFTHTTASGSLTITGFPFAHSGTSNYDNFSAAGWRGITKASYTNIGAYMAGAESQCYFYASGSGQVFTDVGVADVPTGGTVILKFTLNYQI